MNIELGRNKRWNNSLSRIMGYNTPPAVTSEPEGVLIPGGAKAASPSRTYSYTDSKLCVAAQTLCHHRSSSQSLGTEFEDDTFSHS
ncbi:hypothetical protein J6590_048036 [Homalodisca vitripennis]|nr:hypothetical protein J6590_048036 [Homalodisca vitripennis]